MPKQIHISLTALMLYFIIRTSFSHDIDYRFERLTRNEGLSSNSVFSILKDNSGFIWAGGEYGLNRFDGKKIKIFTVFNTKGVMSEGWILSLCDDGDFIWLGTTKGLNKFNKRNEFFTLYLHDSLVENSISSNYINKILKTKNGEIWIATTNGLNKYDRVNDSFIKFKVGNSHGEHNISSDIVQTIFEDSYGDLWIGTGNGLDIFRIRDSSFIHFKNNPEDEFSLSHNSVAAVYEDSRGNIWVSTLRGIDKFERKTNKFYRFIDQRFTNSSFGSDIANISEDIYQNIWFASSSSGILIYDPDNSTFKKILNNPNNNNTIGSNYVASLYNSDSILWIGTNGGGLCSYNFRKWKFDHYKSIFGDTASLSSPIVWSICEDKYKNIWAATSNGLNIFDRNKNRFYLIKHDKNNPNSLSDDNIRYVYRDSKQDMWVVSIGYALEKYIPEINGFKHFYDTNGLGFNGTYFFEDSMGNYWLGCWNGIRIFDKNMKFIKSSLKTVLGKETFSDKSIMSIYEDSRRNIWLATLSGLYIYDYGNDILQSYTKIPDDSNSLSNSSTVAILEDPEGNYWITTYGGGLNKYNYKNNRFTVYTEKHGLAHNLLYGILSDNSGKIWLNSNNGITKFDPISEKFTNYGLGDGVQGLEFASGSFYKSESGEIFFGGINGFNGFIPSEIPVNSVAPKIAFTSFKIFDSEADLPVSVNYTDLIELSYWDNFFSFEFAALDFTNPHSNKCRYILEGIDKNWVEAGYGNIASYTNIQPGEYIFRVTGSNNDGIWNNKGKAIKVIIYPPWWQTAWFRFSVLTIFILVIVVSIRKKFDNIQKEKKAKDEFARQLIASQEKERKLIAYELHDSLVQELLVAKNKAAIAVRNPSGSDENKRYFREISDVLSISMEKVREISHKLKPYEIERFGLTHSLETLVNKINNNSNVRFNYKAVDIDGIFSEEDEVNIFRIIQESINNIIKHSYANNARIDISKDSDIVYILINDNGKGFENDSDNGSCKRNSFGLNGISERVSLMNGKTEIISRKGYGTSINISVPLKRKS